jgi:hypothetical protein
VDDNDRCSGQGKCAVGKGGGDKLNTGGRCEAIFVFDFTTPLLYILASIYFSSSLPSSGSFLDPSELLEIQIEWVAYHIMCGYVACVYTTGYCQNM